MYWQPDGNPKKLRQILYNCSVATWCAAGAARLVVVAWPVVAVAVAVEPVAAAA